MVERDNRDTKKQAELGHLRWQKRLKVSTWIARRTNKNSASAEPGQETTNGRSIEWIEPEQKRIEPRKKASLNNTQERKEKKRNKKKGQIYKRKTRVVRRRKDYDHIYTSLVVVSVQQQSTCTLYSLTGGFLLLLLYMMTMDREGRRRRRGCNHSGSSSIFQDYLFHLYALLKFSCSCPFFFLQYNNVDHPSTNKNIGGTIQRTIQRAAELSG